MVEAEEVEAADDEGRRGQRAGALCVPKRHATNFVECLKLGALVSVMSDVPICRLRTEQVCGTPAQHDSGPCCVNVAV